MLMKKDALRLSHSRAACLESMITFWQLSRVSATRARSRTPIIAFLFTLPEVIRWFYQFTSYALKTKTLRISKAYLKMKKLTTHLLSIMLKQFKIKVKTLQIKAKISK